MKLNLRNIELHNDYEAAVDNTVLDMMSGTPLTMMHRLAKS